MRSDPPSTLPRGRPPALTLVALTCAALALHGCLLDGMPLDAVDPMDAGRGTAASTATAVQVRELPLPTVPEVPAAPVAAAALAARPVPLTSVAQAGESGTVKSAASPPPSPSPSITPPAPRTAPQAIPRAARTLQAPAVPPAAVPTTLAQPAPAAPSYVAVAVEPAAAASVSLAALPSDALRADAAAPDTPPALATDLAPAANAPPLQPAATAAVPPMTAQPAAAQPMPAESAAANRGAAATESTPLRQPARAVPVYRTRIPPATTLHYDLRRGMLSGTGELTWRPEGARYEARLQAQVAGFTLLTQVSQGSFDAAGLAPLRFTDQRARKAAKAANFQRDAGKITFSGPRDEFALVAGSQDRLSWMVQLPAVLSAEPKRAAPGGEVLLYVAGVRADVALWTVRYVAVETIETAAGSIRTVKFMRERDDPKDTLAEVWLDPTRHYLPVRARLTHGDDEAFELVLRGAPAAR
jgi:hypothetical protein